MYKRFTNEYGISLIMAMGFSGLLVLISLGLSIVILPSLLGTGQVEQLNIAYSAAEGGLEDALYWRSKHESGFEYDQDKTLLQDGKNTEMAWNIIARSTEDSAGEYIIPARGEGDSPSDPNWNKVALGESVMMDLFIDFADELLLAPQVRNPANYGGIGDFIMKLRTPMWPEGVTENPELRYAADNEETGIDDDTILTWSFAGQDASGKQYSLYEIIDYDDSSGEPVRNYQRSTEIYESKINNVDQNIVISSDPMLAGQNLPVSNGFAEGYTDLEPNILDFVNDNNLSNLNAQFTVISQLFSDAGEIIPYLEYQIITDVPVPEVYDTIIAHGYAGSYKQTIKMKVRNKGAAALLDFVITQ